MKRLLLVTIILMGSWLAWTSGLAAQGDEDGPVNVGLLSFTASAQADGVRLDWETATELNTAGFFLLRSTDGSNFSEIGYVNSTGGITGDEYSFLDTGVEIGETYTYKLVEIENDSSLHDLETVTITYNPPLTSTSVIINPTNPASGATNTPVATATKTRTPTATAVSTTGSSPTATLQSPAVTPTPTTPPDQTTLDSVSAQSTLPRPTTQSAPALVVDQAFTNNNSNSGVVLAQEETPPAAYPVPENPEPPADTPPDTISYPSEQEQPLEIEPENLTPYPANAGIEAAPTFAVIGSEDPYPPETGGAGLTASSEAVRGRILLWASFLLALFIFLSGVVGAIVLYRRQAS